MAANLPCLPFIYAFVLESPAAQQTSRVDTWTGGRVAQGRGSRKVTLKIRPLRKAATATRNSASRESARGRFVQA